MKTQANEHLFSQFSQLSDVSEGDTSAPIINRYELGLWIDAHSSSSQANGFSNATKCDAIFQLVFYKTK